MYSKKSDIIFTAAGAADHGVIQSGIENNKQSNPVWVIGSDTDMYQYSEYEHNGKTKNVILTSAIKEVGNAAQIGINNSIERKFSGGTYTLGYEQHGVGLPKENENLEESEDIIIQAINSLIKNPPASTLQETKNKTKDMVINGDI